MSKDTHGFSVSVACEVGVFGAIVLQHLSFLQKTTVSAGENWQEKWIKRSARAMTNTYPYWSTKQIRRVLAALENSGFISSKHEEKDKSDFSNYYILTIKGLALLGEKEVCPNGQGGYTQTGNGVCPNGQGGMPKRANDNKVYCTSFVPSFVEEKDAALFSSSPENENQTLEAEKEKKGLQGGAGGGLDMANGQDWSGHFPLTPPFTPTGETIEPKPATVVRLYENDLSGVTAVEPSPSPEYQTNPRETQPAEFRRVNIGEEIERLKTDPAAKETFALVRKIPSKLFDEYVEAFGLEIKGTGETYKDVPALKKHFLNWSGTRFEIAQRQKTQFNGKRSSLTRAGGDLSKYQEKQIF